MTNAEFVEATRAYLEVVAAQKILDARKKTLSSKLMSHLKKNEQTKLLCEGIGDVMIVVTKRDTPQAKLIEEKFDIKLTPECFKHSESEFIKVLPIITEG